LNEPNLTISEAAKRAGVRASAIRYYERVGLIPKADRVSGQRRYGDDVIRRLDVIAVAKKAGFSLDEIRTLLDSAARGEPAHQELRALAEQKLPEIDALIDRARAVREWLGMASDCNCQSLDDCRLFTLLRGGFEDTGGVELKVIRKSPIT